MYGAHAENTIKSIIHEISRECAVRGHVVSDTLAAFMVKAVLLDKRNEFNVDRTLSNQDVQKLIQLSLDKLMEKGSLSLDTIKMQVHFDTNYTSRGEFLEKMHHVIESRLSPVRKQITDSSVKTKEELHAVYQKMITYILLHSAIGSPTDDIAVQEATAALQSVFPLTGLRAFMALSKKDKEQQLAEFTMIVIGIQIFNKASKKEDEASIHELMPKVLKEALPVTNRNIEKELNVTQRLAWKYTALLEKLTDPKNQPEHSDMPIALLKQALYNIRQHEVFLRLLLSDACLCDKHVEILQTELSSQMKLLKETVQSKRAVPTAEVFPVFKVLSKLWSGLKEEAELLNILNNIMLSLQPFITSQANFFPEAYLDSLLKESEIKTDEQRMTESSDERIDPNQLKAQEWLLPETTVNFKELLLQYNGVCAYTLVNRDGLLLPGNPHIGVLKHKEKLYVFSSKEAALKFALSPDDFVAEVAEKVKVSPELIQLLKLHQQFFCVSPHSEPISSQLLKPIIKCESGTQTDIHPMETNSVTSYEWNEWELRRKALKLADLWTKKTHSVQTDLSHMRRENITQTWPPKDAACQSKRDNETNVHRPHIYLAGLRGQRDGPVVKTNLTRPVNDY